MRFSVTLPFHMTPTTHTKYPQQRLWLFRFVRTPVMNSGARPAIPAGPGIAARVPTVKHVVTCAATFRWGSFAPSSLLARILASLAPSEEARHSSQQRRELIHMTDALAFINQYLANAPYMRDYFVSLCPALNHAQAKNESQTSIKGETLCAAKMQLHTSVTSARNLSLNTLRTAHRIPASL